MSLVDAVRDDEVEPPAEDDIDVGSKIETAWANDRPPFRVERVLDALFLLAIGVHGPLDVGITAIAWALESNPVVLELGVWPWVAIKVATLGAATFVWWDSTRPSPTPYPVVAAGWLGLLVGFGAALVFPNVAVLLAEVAS